MLLAVEGSYGIIALAPLGADHIQLGFVLGVLCAVVGNVVAVAAGARGAGVGGSSAPLALLVPPVLVVLLADPALRLPDGRPDALLLLAMVGVGVVAAGVLMRVAGTLRLGSLVRYVPYPVHAGFLNAVALLMALAMLPAAVGLPDGGRLSDIAQARPLSLGVAAVTLAIALRPPRWTRAVPSLLTAGVAGSALHHVLALAFGGALLGPLLGPLSLDWAALVGPAPLVQAASGGHLVDHAGVLGVFALVLMLTASLQTLLATSIVDSLTGQRHDGERVLRADGTANVAVGLLGLLPYATSVSRSYVSVLAGGRGKGAALVFAACLLGALAVGAGLLRFLPMSVIAGVVGAVAVGMIDPWTRRATVLLARQLASGQRPPASLGLAYAVMGTVVAVSLAVSLIHGVLLGIGLAILLFLRSNLRPAVRQVTRADRQGSRKVRPPADAALLRAHGGRIAVIELDGALFFGTADAVAREIARLAEDSDQLVLDFHRVGEVDASGARVLVQAAIDLRTRGKRLLLASLETHAGGPLPALREMDVAHALGEDAIHPDVDQALEAAEERLLDGLRPRPGDDQALTLAQTQLGAGLDGDELQILARSLQVRRAAAGSPVFRHGDPGDGLFVAVRGQIGIWLPAVRGPYARSGQRLVSFAPGVVFGEIGLLRGSARSADAWAETDAVLLLLTRPAYERLAAEHPRLLGKLLLNLSLQLSDRLAALTEALQAGRGLR